MILFISCVFSLNAKASDYGCLEDGRVSCLLEGRFKVTAWVKKDVGLSQINMPARIKKSLIGDEASLFYFFTYDNPELLVKVVDACAINGKHWVFASAATDLDYQVVVSDLVTNYQKTYTGDRSNSLIKDTLSFSCSSAPGGGGGSDGPVARDGGDGDGGDGDGGGAGDVDNPIDRNGGNGDSGDTSNNGGPYVQIKGLQDFQPVLLTVKTKEEDHIIGTVKTHYNSKVDLSSLNLNYNKSYVITGESDGYRGIAPSIIWGEDFEPKIPKEIILPFEKIEDNSYRYHWESHSEGEYEYSSNVPGKPDIEFLGEVVDAPEHSSAQVLLSDYNLILSNEGVAWTIDYSHRLRRIVQSIPHESIERTKVVLKNKFIANDIQIEEVDGQSVIHLSIKAFNYASPKMVRLDGVRGQFFSHRLFKAMVYFYTNYGRNRSAAEKILNEKFGVLLDVPNIQELTGEHPDNFQPFHNVEVLEMISTLVEMPSGYHKIPGLRYLLRRRNGHPHPLYPDAAAVAWPRGPNTDSYIEFMEKAFSGGLTEYVHRLILHEKSHFIWTNVLSDAIKEDWIETAGWYEDENAQDGWSNKYTTSFVSPYAHALNPNEDMAESLSHYVLNPNKLRSVSPAKFDFIQRRIMNGYRYISQIREDLQFEVLNLFPDYDYPGKIKRIDVIAKGSKTEDKTVTIEIELSDKEGLYDGASSAYMRLVSPGESVFDDLGLHPVGNNNHILRGVTTIPKHAKSGYWKTYQIVVEDETGNRRMESQKDFGFKLYINNAIEDTIAPKYVRNSLNIEVTPSTLEGRPTHYVEITWDINENFEMSSGGGAFVYFTALDSLDNYSLQRYGDVDLQTNKATVGFHLTEYFPSGRYAVTFLQMRDKALNYGDQYFSSDPNHEEQRIVFIQTSNPDSGKPVLDLNRITVSAEPFNSEQPDGQTYVTITYYAKDDKSGVGTVAYVLRDPLGKIHFYHHYHNNFHTNYFKGGDPTVYKKYVIDHVLPKGSAPGTWGLFEMTITDKGGNIATYEFSELMHFKVLQ